MTLIRLTRASDGAEVWINPIRIVSVAKSANGDTTMIDTQCEDGSMYSVAEPINEVLRLIFGDLEKPMPVEGIAWAEHPAAMLNRKIGSLEAERDSARRTASVDRTTAGRLECRKSLLESQIKAWQDAASVQLVEDSDDARIPCETHEQLIERLRTLYRWWSTAEQRAKAAEQDAINERESHSRTRKNADEWCHRACVAENEARRLKTAVKAEEPLEPNRVIKTAHALITEAAKNPRTFHQKGYLFRLAKDAIEALYGGSTPKLEPYQTKGQL